MSWVPVTRGGARAGAAVRKVVLHTDPETMPRPPQFVRALLHETAVVRDERNATWTLR